jgi:hypothetical protein
VGLAGLFALAALVLGAMPPADPGASATAEGPLTSPAGVLGLETAAATADRPGLASDLRTSKHRWSLATGMLSAGAGIALICITRVARRRRPEPWHRPASVSALERAPPFPLLALP